MYIRLSYTYTQNSLRLNNNQSLAMFSSVERGGRRATPHSTRRGQANRCVAQISHSQCATKYDIRVYNTRYIVYVGCAFWEPAFRSVE